MRLGIRFPFLLLFVLGCIATLSVQAQPDTIFQDAPVREPSTRSKREIKDEQRALKRFERSEVFMDNVVLFEIGRLASSRFPSLTFTYQRFFNEQLAVVGSLGLPINDIDVYEELTGSFSGIDARIGGKVFLSKYQGSRWYFSVDGWLTANPVRARTFVQEPDLPTFRAQELNLTRKRQMINPSFGFQGIGFNGVSVDLQLGVTTGRRGIFAEGDVNYLSDGENTFFGNTQLEQNEWSAFIDWRIGIALGYAF